MSAYEKGLARLITRPDLVDGLTIRDRQGGLGVLTVEGGVFIVRLRIDPRPVRYPPDSFATGALRLQLADEYRLRKAITELGKEKESGKSSAQRALDTIRAYQEERAGTTAFIPTQVKVAAEREVDAPTLRPTARPAGLANDAQIPGEALGLTFRIAWSLITGPLADPKVYVGGGMLAGLQMTALDTAANRAAGAVPGTAYRISNVAFDTSRRRDARSKAPPGDDINDELVVSLMPAGTRGTRRKVDCLADEVLDNFDIVLASVAGTSIPALAVALRTEELARAADTAARQAEQAARLPGREAPYVRPVAAPASEEERKAQKEAREAAKLRQQERFLLEETMAARAAVPVAITYADAVNGMLFNKVPLTSPPFAGMSIPAIGQQYVANVVAMREAYDAARAAVEAVRDAGGKAKMPKFPYSVMIAEMANGTRVMFDMTTGGLRRDVSSEKVTQRLDVILNPPKVGATSVDTQAAQEMRSELSRAGYIVEGVGGRRHYSDPLLQEVRGTAPSYSHILESYDPRMEGQTRSGEQLLGYRGRSRFAKMLDATPITETKGSRGERAEEMGYGLSEDEITDMLEAMRVTSGQRLTSSASKTAFRKKIKLKEDEIPTGEIAYDELAEEYHIVGTRKAFADRERAIAFLQKLGVPGIYVTGEDVLFDEDIGEGGGSAEFRPFDFSTPFKQRD